jgi:hypothetical protein
MEGSIQNQIWTLGAISHVLWTHKLTKYLPGNDERHL